MNDTDKLKQSLDPEAFERERSRAQPPKDCNIVGHCVHPEDPEKRCMRPECGNRP